MKEIFFISSHFFLLFFLFLFPLHFLKKRIVLLNNFNFYDLICLNILFQFNIYLFFSFFYSNITLLIYLFVILSIALSLYFFLKNKLFYKDNYNLILSIFLFLLVVLCNYFAIANNFRLQWDAIAHWFWKVQNFYQGGDIKNLKDLPYSFYPHLGTFLWANFWKLFNSPYEYLGRFYYSYIYLSAVFSILYSIKSKYFFLITCAISYLIINFFVLGGYQDFLVFFLITYIARLFYLLCEKKINIYFFIILFIANLNLLIWSKQEGIIYSFILFLVFLLSFKSILRIKITLMFFLLLIIFTYFYLNFLFKESLFFHEPIQNNFERLKNFKIFFDSIILISLHLIKALIQNVVIILSIIMWLFMKIIKKESFLKIDFIITFFIFNILLIYSIFLHTSFSLEGMLAPVIGRLLLQTSGFYLVTFIYFFNSNLKNEK